MCWKGGVTYNDINGQELGSGLRSEREGEVNFAAVGGFAEVTVSDGWVADGVVVWAGDEAFEFFDQVKRGFIDIGPGALGVEGGESSQHGGEDLRAGEHLGRLRVVSL